MRSLTLFRHALPVFPHEFQGADADRPLSKLGRKLYRQQLAILTKLSLPIDQLWVSPTLRTRQTATMLRKACIVTSKPVICHDIALHYDLDRTIEAISISTITHLGLVTHEPVIGAILAHYFSSSLPIEISIGHVCQLDLSNPGYRRLALNLPQC